MPSSFYSQWMASFLNHLNQVHDEQIQHEFLLGVSMAAHVELRPILHRASERV